MSGLESKLKEMQDSKKHVHIVTYGHESRDYHNNVIINEINKEDKTVELEGEEGKAYLLIEDIREILVSKTLNRGR